MNWGMGMALGKAIQGAGDTWGRERIDLRRQLDQDQLDKQSHEMRMRTGEQGLAIGEQTIEQNTVQTAALREQLEQARKINPMAVQKMEQDIETGKLTREQAALSLGEITKDIAAKDAIPNFRGQILDATLADARLRPQATQANINQSNQAISRDQHAMKLGTNADTRAGERHQQELLRFSPDVLHEDEVERQMATMAVPLRNLMGAYQRDTLENTRMIEDPTNPMAPKTVDPNQIAARNQAIREIEGLGWNFAESWMQEGAQRAKRYGIQWPMPGTPEWEKKKAEVFTRYTVGMTREGKNVRQVGGPQAAPAAGGAPASGGAPGPGIGPGF